MHHYNVSLIGLPLAGKTSIVKQLAKNAGKPVAGYLPRHQSKANILDRGLQLTHAQGEESFVFTTLSGGVWHDLSWFELLEADVILLVWDAQKTRRQDNQIFFDKLLVEAPPNRRYSAITTKNDLRSCRHACEYYFQDLFAQAIPLVHLFNTGFDITLEAIVGVVKTSVPTTLRKKPVI